MDAFVFLKFTTTKDVYINMYICMCMYVNVHMYVCICVLYVYTVYGRIFQNLLALSLWIELQAWLDITLSPLSLHSSS